MMKKGIFWIFGTLQSLSLAAIIYLLFNGMNEIATVQIVGKDTQLVLSIVFPLFLLLTQYIIYSKPPVVD